MLAVPFALVLSTILAPGQAPALGFDCAKMLETFGARSERIHEARGPLQGPAHHWQNLRLSLASLPLRFGPIGKTADICPSLATNIERDQLIFTNAKAVLSLVRRHCRNRNDVTLRLTRAALAVTQFHGGTGRYAEWLYDFEVKPWTRSARANVRRWLDHAIAENSLGRLDWLGIMTEHRYRVLPVLDATEGDLDRIGLTPADRLVLARALARENVPFATLAKITGPEPERLGELAQDLNPIQWLEYLSSRGELTAAILPEFSSRVIHFSRDQQVWNDAADRAMLALLYDTEVPFELFVRLDQIVRPHWLRLFSTNSTYDYFLPGHVPEPRLDAEQRARAERFYERTPIASGNLRRASQGLDEVDRRTIETLTSTEATTADKEVARMLRYLALRSLEHELKATRDQLEALRGLGAAHGFRVIPSRPVFLRDTVPFVIRAGRVGEA